MNKLTSKIASVIRAAAGVHSPEDHFISAIVVAAGLGTRMGTSSTKQLIGIDGIPVVVRSLLAFQSCDFINEIIVVGRENELSLYDEWKEQYGITKLKKAVCGGKTRRESVENGLSAISDRSEYLAIHDGARCLITPEMIKNVLTETLRYGAAAAAEAMTDTVKRIDEKGFITETIDRSELLRVQTPQAFKTSLYLASAYTVDKDDPSITDDCMLAEKAGFHIKLVDCGRENLKITTREDLVFAEAILTARRLRKLSEQAQSEGEK